MSNRNVVLQHECADLYPEEYGHLPQVREYLQPGEACPRCKRAHKIDEEEETKAEIPFIPDKSAMSEERTMHRLRKNFRSDRTAPCLLFGRYLVHLSDAGIEAVARNKVRVRTVSEDIAKEWSRTKVNI